MSSRPFEAQYPGECEECGERFPPGTTIRITSGSAAVHDICPDDEPSPHREVCPCCFTEQSVSGACACEDPA